ncbi:hypothetical protein D9M68_876690 [compost metagenome]
MYLNSFGGGEAFEQFGEVQGLQRVGVGALQLVVGMDLAVFMFMALGMRLVAAEQRAFDLLLGHLATGGGGDGEERQGLFQLGAGGGDLGLVGVTLRRVLETHQVHRRAFQFQLQGLVVQHDVQARHAMLVGAEAAMRVMVVVMFLGLGGDQG